jgi:methionyl-tRNA formyltransferase
VARGLPLAQPDRLRDPAVTRLLAEWAPDLGVVVAYGKMIPDELLQVPRLGMINVHASLLPKYRGAAPVHRAVIDGERETGVTIMRVVKALDAGDVFDRATRPIGRDETSEEVERDLAEIGARLLVDVVDRLERGPVPEHPQETAASTYAAKLTKEEGLVDWTQPARRIHDRVRGLTPWPHAYAYIDGVRVILLRTRLTGERTELAPGTIVEVTPDAITVAAGDQHAIAIEEIQPEGRRPMRVRDYLAGRSLEPGARFTGR